MAGATGQIGSPTAIEEGGWVERIKWTTLARVAALSSLLAFAVAMDLGLGPQPLSAAPEVVLYQIVSAGFILSFVALLLTYLLADRHGRVLAWASLAIDAALTGALVVASNGLDSVLLFTLPLAVLSGAVLLGRAGAFSAAAAATCVLFAMASIDLGWVRVDLDPWTMSWVRALGPRDHAQPFDIAVQFLVQVGALYATALLSSHLMVELIAARAGAQRGQRELTALRARYQDVFSSMPDGLVTVGADGVIGSVNPAFLRIVRLEEQALVGRRLADVLPSYTNEEPSNSWMSETTEITRESPEQPSEFIRRSFGGSMQTLAVRSVSLRGPEGSDGMLLVVRDITELRAREEAHRARERLATVGSMAMAVAHEIRNPLASISGAVQMLGENRALDETDLSLMEIATRETAALSRWIGEFLDFARPGKAHMGPLNLGRIVREKLAACRQDPRVDEAGTEISSNLEPVPEGGDDERWHIIGDASRLEALVWNLLVNANQAVLGSEVRRVQVTLTADEDYVQLGVADSGPGVAEEDKSHIFEPFYTTKGEGTGLGLATVRRVAATHRGQVRVVDGPLGGAEFLVTLPRDPGLRGLVVD